jgi:hypothetical protein
VDIRCGNKKHGSITDSGLLEVKCNSRFCGAAPGTVVLHLFDAHSGELVKTVMYKNPERGELRNAAYNDSAAVRSA